MRRLITAARRADFGNSAIRFGLGVAACAAASGLLAPAGATASVTGMSLELMPIGRAADAPQALYVDGGSVGGPCDDSRPASAVTVTTPWCTLQRAFAAAPAGSTVYVRRGSYPLLQVGSFAPSSTVTFTAYPGEQPVLAGVSLGSPMTHWAAPASIQNLVLSGFKITNPGVSLQNFSNVQLVGNEIAISPVPPTNCVNRGSFDASSCTVNTPTAISLNIPASNLTVANNYIHDGWMGVVMRNGNPPGTNNPPTSTYRNISITNNKFENMGGVVLQIENFQGVTVSHNVFANDELRPDIDPYCHCEAMHVIGGGDQLMIDSNLIYGGRGISIQPRRPDNSNCDPICLKVTGATIQNNVMAGTDFGLWVLSSPGIRIINNTIWGTEAFRDGLGLRIDGAPPATTGVVLANNLIRNLEVQSGVGLAVEDYNDIASTAVGPGLITTFGPHDISAQPVFVNPGPPSWNFDLAPGSPGVGAGSAAYGPGTNGAAATSTPPSMGAHDPGNTSPPGLSSPQGGTGSAPPSSGSGSARRAPTVFTHGSVSQSAGRARVAVSTGVTVKCSGGHTACPLTISVFAAGSGRRGVTGARWHGLSRHLALRRQRSVPAAGTRSVRLWLSARLLTRLVGRAYDARLQLVITVPSTRGRHEFTRFLFVHAPKRSRHGSRRGHRPVRHTAGFTG